MVTVPVKSEDVLYWKKTDCRAPASAVYLNVTVASPSLKSSPFKNG